MTTWQLLPTGAQPIDITNSVVLWEVEYGMEFAADEGHWAPRSATGALTVDALAFTAHLAALGDINGPILCAYNEGDKRLFTGLVEIAPPNLLADPTTLARFQLKGRYSQVWLSSAPYRHVSFQDVVASYPAPLEFAKAMVDRAGQAAGYGAIPGVLEPFPPSQIMVDTDSMGPEVEWIYPRVTGTVAQNWRDICRVAACVAYETSEGRLGMKTMPQILAEAAPAVPAMHADLGRSTVSDHAPSSPWAIKVGGSKGVAAGPVMNLTTVSVVLDERDNETTEFVGTAVLDYPIPSNIVDILWTRNPTAPAGATKVTVSVDPLVDRNVERLTVEVRASTRPTGALTAQLTGRIVRQYEVSDTAVKPANATNVQYLPDSGWVNYSSSTPPSLTDWTRYIAVLNLRQRRFRLTYPTSQVPLTHMTPGSQAVYRVSDELSIQGVCHKVRFRGRRNRLPRVEISGMAFVGQAAKPSLPGPVPTPEAGEEYPGTPDTSADPQNPQGHTGRYRFRTVLEGRTRSGRNLFALLDPLGNYWGWCERNTNALNRRALFFMTTDLGRVYGSSITALGIGFGEYRRPNTSDARSWRSSSTRVSFNRSLTGDLRNNWDDEGRTTIGDVIITIHDPGANLPTFLSEDPADDIPPALSADQVVTPDPVPNRLPAANVPTIWNGRTESNRANDCIVLHTAENGKPFTAGARNDVAAYLRTVQRYAGYHIIVDLGGYTTYLNPKTHRAYHAKAGNDCIGISFAGRTTDWASLSDSDRAKLFATAAKALKDLGLNRSTWKLATTVGPNNILSHSDIQDDRSDPGLSATELAELRDALNA